MVKITRSGAGKKGKKKALKAALEAIDDGRQALIMSVGQSKIEGFNSISVFDPTTKRTVAVLIEEDDLNIESDKPEAAMQACIMLMRIFEVIEPTLPEGLEECDQLNNLIQLLRGTL